MEQLNGTQLGLILTNNKWLSFEKLIDTLKNKFFYKKYGYGHVSLVGQGLELQLKLLEAVGCRVTYFDKSTGLKSERTEFTKLIKKLKKGDTLVVTTLEGLGCDTERCIKVVRELFESGVNVHVLNVGKSEGPAMEQIFLKTLQAAMELNRITIVERMADGKARAKLNEDYREGRPKKYTEKELNHAISMLTDHSYTQVETLTGISKSTLVRAVRKINSSKQAISTKITMY